MEHVSRRVVLVGGASVAAAFAGPAKDATSKPTVLKEQTYLKAAAGERANLIKFIVANWFVMDQKALDQGYFTSYELLEDIDENKDWDLVMVVGYPQAQGYEEPATMAAFKAIRAAHKEVAIEGKSLKQLGSIVRHHRLRLTG